MRSGPLETEFEARRERAIQIAIDSRLGGDATLLWVGRQRGSWCPLRHRWGLARGGRGGTGGRRRWDLGKNFLVGGLQPSHLTPNLFLSGSKPPNGLPQLVEALRHLLRLLRVEGGGGWLRCIRLLARFAQQVLLAGSLAQAAEQQCFQDRPVALSSSRSSA